MKDARSCRVLQATTADTPLVADIRLRALRDAPGAFLTRYEDSPPPGHEDWHEVVAKWTRPPDNAVFVATLDDVGVGMCGCFLQNPSRAMLVAMWVAPGMRGSTVGTRLVERVFAFARDRAVNDVGAWVVEDNHRAIGFYRKNGFAAEGSRQTFDPEPEKHELLFVRDLRPERCLADVACQKPR